MGKTSSPIRICITSPVVTEWPELVPIIAKLVEQGHVIDVNPTLEAYDFVIGPNAWYVAPDVAGLFELAIKNARVVASERKKNKPKVEKKAKVSKKKKVTVETNEVQS